MNRTVLDEFESCDKLLLIGPFFPMVGGVSVFLERLAYQYKNHEKFFFVGGSFGAYFNLSRTVYRERKNTICLNTVNFLVASFFVFFNIFFRCETIFIDHNDRQFDKGFLYKILFKLFLRTNKKNIVVGSSTLIKYQKNKISNVIEKNSFIPPNLTELNNKLENLDESLISFTKKRRKLIVSNASNLVIEDGVDLYGIDLCINLLNKIVNEDKIDAGLLLFISKVSDYEYLRKLERAIFNKGLSDFIYFNIGDSELWPIFSISDLSIRATSKDGFGISVAESIYLNCPCVASDVCKRYPGAILFKSRDLSDLYVQALKILKEDKNEK